MPLPPSPASLVLILTNPGPCHSFLKSPARLEDFSWPDFSTFNSGRVQNTGQRSKLLRTLKRRCFLSSARTLRGAMAGQLSGTMPWCQTHTLNHSQKKQASNTHSLQPDCTLTSELQVWMKFVFKLFPIDRCATATCPIRRQVVTRPVPQSTTQKEPEVKGLFQVQRGMLWAASTPAQPPVDTL